MSMSMSTSKPYHVVEDKPLQETFTPSSVTIKMDQVFGKVVSGTEQQGKHDAVLLNDNTVIANFGHFSGFAKYAAHAIREHDPMLARIAELEAANAYLRQELSFVRSMAVYIPNDRA